MLSQIQTQKYQGLGAPEISHQLEREINRSHQTAHPPPVILQAHRLRIAQDVREFQKTSQQSGIADVNQLVRDMLQSNADLETKRIAAEKQRQQAERDEKNKRKEIERETEEKRWQAEEKRKQAEREAEEKRWQIKQQNKETKRMQEKAEKEAELERMLALQREFLEEKTRRLIAEQQLAAQEQNSKNGNRVSSVVSQTENTRVETVTAIPGTIAGDTRIYASRSCIYASRSFADSERTTSVATVIPNKYFINTSDSCKPNTITNDGNRSC